MELYQKTFFFFMGVAQVNYGNKGAFTYYMITKIILHNDNDNNIGRSLILTALDVRQNI